MKSYYYLLVVFFFECHNTERKQDSVKVRENYNSPSVKLSEQITERGNQDVNNKDLLGSWFPNINENASFNIELDSIFYLDNNKSYKYNIKNDTMIIFFDEEVKKYLITKLSDKELVLMDIADKEMNKFFR